MDNGMLLDLWRDALITTAKVGGPFILGALAVGLLVSIIQAATQLQENVLTFVPKLIVIGLLLALAGQSLLSELTRYTERTAAQMVEIGRNAGSR